MTKKKYEIKNIIWKKRRWRKRQKQLNTNQINELRTNDLKIKIKTEWYNNHEKIIWLFEEHKKWFEKSFGELSLKFSKKRNNMKIWHFIFI